MWKRFVSNRHHFSPTDPDYRRAYLVNTILVTLIANFSLFAVLDVTIADYVGIALINLTGALASAATLYFFQRTHRLRAAALATSIILLAVLAAFVTSTGHLYYAFYWLAVFPPIALFLLGLRTGLAFTLALFAYVYLFLMPGYADWAPAPFGIEALLNIGAASIFLTALIAYFELSKEETDLALQQKNRELLLHSVTDSLTGLANRKRIEEVILYEVGRMQRSTEPFSLIMADLDKFKLINDSLGHLAGDAVLVEAADVIRQSCRQHDTVGRWGGEEFVIICPGTRLAGAGSLAEKIRTHMATQRVIEARQMTVSLGVTEYRPDDTLDSLLKRADVALYQAKANGRNRVALAAES